MKAAMIGRDGTLAASAMSDIVKRTGFDITLFPRVGRGLKRFLEDDKVDLVYIPDGDLLSSYRLVRLRKRYGFIVRFYSVMSTVDQRRVGWASYIDGCLLRVVDRVTFYVKVYGIRNLHSFLFHLLLLLGLYIIKPFRHIVFVRMLSTRLGHFALNTYNFAMEVSASPPRKRVRYIGLAIDPANQTLLSLWRRSAIFWRIVTNGFLVDTIRHGLIRSSPFFKDINWHGSVYRKRVDKHGSKVFLSFTAEEEKRGRRLLAEMGVDDWWVCIHSRDAEYLNAEHVYREDWSYHGFRNTSIETCIPAADWITQQGVYVIRMGYHVAEELETDNSRIIDYASHHRSDFGDIYLPAGCRFFLGTPCGLPVISTVFNVPLVMANTVQVESISCLRKGDIWIPKRFFWSEQERYLTLTEILQSGLGRATSTKAFQEQDVVLLENSQEEILELCQEAYARLNGAWEDTEEDIELQRRYREIINSDEKYWCVGVEATLASTFLRRYTDFLR